MGRCPTESAGLGAVRDDLGVDGEAHALRGFRQVEPGSVTPREHDGTERGQRHVPANHSTAKVAKAAVDHHLSKILDSSNICDSILESTSSMDPSEDSA